METLNMTQIFNELDQRREAAQAIIAKADPAEVAKAQRVCSKVYGHDLTSLNGLEFVAHRVTLP